MHRSSYARPRNLVAGTTAVAVAAAVWLVPATGHAGAVNKASSIGRTSAVAAPAALQAATTDPNLYPFGAPTGNGDFKVPPPPEEPTLIPTIATKTTTRLYGADPFQEAVSITQHIWPAAVPLNNPAENDNDPDRPWALTLLTPDDPLTDITAVPLIHFPDDAPILYVTKTGIPQVTLNEIKRLGDTGISRYKNVDVFLVGAAANPAVEAQLKAIGIISVNVTAPTVPDLANKVDKLYGSIENPDTGVANMSNGMENVMIGSMDGTDYQYLLPATHWVAHMASGLQWVHKDSVPAATITALKRRAGQARMYLFGGPQQISAAVANQLAKYGTVIRVTNDDIVAFNADPVDNPVDTAIAFAKMWDPAGMVGWKITGPGHGFTLVNINDWQAAVASAPLSHLGFHAPLLFTTGPTTLPTADDGYLSSVAPTYLTTPADGPYNMTYVIGSWAQIGWPQQAHVDYISEMGNRRLWNQNTGGRYGDSSQ
ncbi:MAG: hypothetical protein QOE76_3001 [Frankiales bacterium]|jgi:hypothetical protein|nr:hypothetical protein [Frankiales bacterium]